MAYGYGDHKFALRRAMAERIAKKHANPNEWNAAARTAAETLGLDVTRVAFHATLDLTCASIVDEAERHGRALVAVQTAIEAL